MNKKISVIVPVYNSEKTIDRCINSLLNQTYDNFELILVDDGSNDNSSTILDNYAKKDQRIKVIHKNNGGVSSARNKGLEKATGDYITFCDSDDVLLKVALENYIKSFEENADVEIVFSKYVSLEANIEFNNNDNSLVKNHKLLSNIDAIKIAYSPKDRYFVTIWNKAFKRTLIFNDDGFLPFSKYSWGEDELWLMQILQKASCIDCINSINYVWVQENNSLTRKVGTKGLHDVYCVKESIYHLYEKNNDLKIILSLEQYRNIFNIAIKAYFNDDNELLNEMFQAIVEYEKCAILKHFRLLEVVKKEFIFLLLKLHVNKKVIERLANI